MKHLITATICFIATHSFGQSFSEGVSPKGSATFYEDHTIEQVPANYAKIDRLQQKDTLQADLTATWKRNKVSAVQKKAAPLEQPHKRHYKSVSLELGGRALTYSVNFDMRTERGRRNGWGLTAGLGVVGSKTRGQGIVIFVPFSGNYLFGKKKDFLELGVGATYLLSVGGIGLDSGRASSGWNWLDRRWNVTNDDDRIFGTFTFGYRHIPLANGITWRLAFNPIFINARLRPWFGVGIGYQFW